MTEWPPRGARVVILVPSPSHTTNGPREIAGTVGDVDEVTGRHKVWRDMETAPYLIDDPGSLVLAKRHGDRHPWRELDGSLRELPGGGGE